MVLLAVPRSEAIVLNDTDTSILYMENTATLTALCRVRKVEASTASAERLRELDRRIQVLKSKTAD